MAKLLPWLLLFSFFLLCLHQAMVDAQRVKLSDKKGGGKGKGKGGKGKGGGGGKNKGRGGKGNNKGGKGGRGGGGKGGGTNRDFVTQRELDRAINQCKREVERIAERGGGGGGGGRRRGNNGLEDLVKVKNNYYLAFRASAGIGESAYNYYVNANHDDDSARRSLIPCGCLSLTGKKPCNRHYKSRIISLWSSMKIDKVRVSVYNGGKEEIFLEFDGEDTTAMSFFSAGKLQKSSFTDTSSAVFNFFSIQGHERLPEVKRRFFINRSYGGDCQQDQGWLMVVESPDDCDYTKGSPVPAILYSNAQSSQNWNQPQISSGDTLVISVKFKNKFNPNNLQLTGQCLK